jgi:hypothetical protein
MDKANEESQALQADWLIDFIEMCVTDEIFNEINRRDDAGHRRERRAFARMFPVLSAPPADVEQIKAKLLTVLPEGASPSQQSDFRQVNKAIASGISVFTTHDEGILSRATQVADLFGLRVVRPGQLIVELDALRREDEYRPGRLAGTCLSNQRSSGASLSSWAAAFQNGSSGEAKRGFSQTVSAFLARPEQHEVWLACSENAQLAALTVWDFTHCGELRLPVFRVARGPLVPTLARYLAFAAVRAAVERKCVVTRITDKHLQAEVKGVLRSEFAATGANELVKVNPFGAGTAADLAALLEQTAVAHGLDPKVANPFGSQLTHPETLASPEKVLQIEKTVWPFKVQDGQLPCFIMPIEPKWAKHLFDYRLAERELLGADETIAMNREFVYYRSRQPKLPTAPARVLWYVSKRVGQLRAASLVTEAEIGPAESLFRKYQRYGVYLRQHVQEKAGGDMRNEVIAVTCCNTESLPHTIPFKALTAALRDHSIRTQFQSPIRVSSEAYFQLYRAAASGAGHA